MPEDTAAQHVVRTLRALEYFAAESQTQADLARNLGVHRRTARRLISRLEREGYVEATRYGRQVSYAATPRLVVLGRQVADNLDLLAILKRHLEEIPSAQAESRSIMLLADREVHAAVVERFDNSAGKSVDSSSNNAIPLHATAPGKVFLSADTALLETVLHQELVAFTDKTLVSRADLLVDLAAVRSRGYAIEDGEHHARSMAVASRVSNHAGDSVAAFCATPVDGTALDLLGDSVSAAARTCSREIGAAV